jgi:multimeric flavodoxin WrbA
MKVLMLNGSPDSDGCTMAALEIVAGTLKDEGIDSEIIQTGKSPVRDCIACNACAKLDNQCAFGDDCVNEFLRKAKDADGFVFGTPVYYAHPSGRVLSLLDRIFCAGSSVLSYKPGFAVACARRAGTIASLDVMNKYFTINQMPLVGSTYWTEVHGAQKADVAKDREGVETMIYAAKNLVWLIKCIESGKKSGITIPCFKKVERTNFIR